MNRLLTISVLFLFAEFGFSQVQNLPLNFKYNQIVKKIAIKNHEVTSFKPLNRQFLSEETYNEIYLDSSKYYYDFTLKLFKENLLDIDEKEVRLVADPLFLFARGRTYLPDTTRLVFTNTRGVRVAGDITSKFSFETRYYETQEIYPFYLDSIARKRSIAFGKGRAKPFKTYGWDVGTAMGYVSFKATDWMNIQFGNTNHFIGNGYRSLLLADNGLNYPNLTIQTSLLNDKVRYINTNAWLQSLERIPFASTPESQYKSKDASFRYLIVHPFDKLELGIFEGTIYKSYSDSLGEIPPNYSFYIPVIGMATAVNGLKSENKVVLGVNGNYRLSTQLLFFGQYAMDANGKAFQLGVKWFDLFDLRNSWLHVEYNHVDPYMYTMSAENHLQTYSHSNQELAYTLGASSNEFIAKFYYTYDRFYGMISSFVASKRRFNGSVEGEDIFQPNDLPGLGNVEKVNWDYTSLELGYNFNIQTRMNAFVNVNLRNESGTNWRTNETFWQVGFRTQLNNYYHER